MRKTLGRLTDSLTTHKKVSNHYEYYIDDIQLETSSHCIITHLYHYYVFGI